MGGRADWPYRIENGGVNNLIYTTLRLFRIYVSPGPQEIPGAVYRVPYQTAVPNYRLGVRWTAARAGQWLRAVQKSTASISAPRSGEAGKTSSAFRASAE